MLSSEFASWHSPGLSRILSIGWSERLVEVHSVSVHAKPEVVNNRELYPPDLYHACEYRKNLEEKNNAW